MSPAASTPAAPSAAAPPAAPPSGHGAVGHHALAAGATVAMALALALPSYTYRAPTLPCVAASLVFLVPLFVLERRRPQLRRGFVWAAIAVLLVLAVAYPPRRSKDLWQYAMYGRMVAVHHTFPYGKHVPCNFSHDPAFKRISPVWRCTPSLYGPGFTLVSAAIQSQVGMSRLSTRLPYQALAALATLGTALLIDRRTRHPAAAFLFVANPAIVYWTTNSAHNDAILGLAILAAVLAAERRRPVWAGVLVGLAILTKAIGGLVLLPLAWWLWHQRRRGALGPRSTDLPVAPAPGPSDEGPIDPAALELVLARRGAHRRLDDGVVAPEPPVGIVDAAREPVLLGLAATVVTAAGFAVGGGIGALKNLANASTGTSWESLWRWTALRFGGPRYHLPAWANHLSLVVLAAVVLAVAWASIADRRPLVGAAAVFAAFYVAAPYELIWYVAWSLPLVLLRWRSRATAAYLAFVLLLVVASEQPVHYGRPPHVKGFYDGFNHAVTDVLWWTKGLIIVGLLGLSAWAVWQRRQRRRLRVSSPAA